MSAALRSRALAHASRPMLTSPHRDAGSVAAFP
jgi:hypothetical protein